MPNLPTQPNQAMRLIITLLILAALTFMVYALASGPSLIEIIDNPKF